MEQSGAWDFAAEFKIDIFWIRIPTDADNGVGDDVPTTLLSGQTPSP